MISGEPVPNLNGCLIDRGPDDAARLRQYVAAIRRRGLPGFLWLTSAAQHQLAPLATELGLTVAGQTPLMSYELETIPDPSARYQVEAVGDQYGIDAFTDLMARGFELPLDTWRRLVTPKALQDPAITHVLAFLEGKPISGGTAIVTGANIGIWNMATPPEHQRKGAGSAVLNELLRIHALKGQRSFYLIASEAGKHLYDQVGFRTVDEATLWLITA